MNRRSARVRVGLLTIVTAAVLLAGSFGVASGEEGIGGVLRFLFGGGNAAREAEAQEAPADINNGVIQGGEAPLDFENQYTPLLSKVANAELHFAHKICNFDRLQFDTMTRTGRRQVAVIARNYAKQQNQHQTSTWPDARDMITDAFQKQIDELMPSEVAAQYREEIAARRKARQEAAREMMTMLVDRKLSLTEEQYDEIGHLLGKNWEADWSRNMQIFLYDDYAPMPPDNLLRPLLSERQRGVWSSRTNWGRIQFGWEQDLGLMGPWGEIGELEIEAPAPKSKGPSADASEESP